ncbi:MAG: MiaB/RimO family radical SAM methylthiotransferase, partial [Candidatus Bathyarchaeia archaeon]
MCCDGKAMRVFVKSFGCSTNLADGQVLAGCLSKARFEIARSASTADVVVCNTCAVKEPTENRIIDILKKIPSDKKLVVVGCLPLINFDRLSKEVRFDAAAGPALGSRIVELVERVLSNEKVVWLQNADDSLPMLGLPRIRQNRVISIIPISYGCLGSCAYCCVTHARGRLRSYG